MPSVTSWSDSLIGVAVTVGTGGIVLASPAPSAASWPFIAGSAALHVAYMLLLMRCYRLGEFSQVYRGHGRRVHRLVVPDTRTRPAPRRGGGPPGTAVASVRPHLMVGAWPAGMLSLAAYALVLWAQNRGALAPIAALRESSVIVGAVIGAVLFGEPFGRWRIAAITLVAGGVVLITL